MDLASIQKQIIFEEKKRFSAYLPHRKQLQFHAGHAAKERLFRAGNRTGKTYGGVAECCMHLTGNYPYWWDDFNLLKDKIPDKYKPYYPDMDTDWGKGKRFNRPIKAWAASVTTDLTSQVLQDNGYFAILPKEFVKPIKKLERHYAIKHVSGGYSELTFKSYKQGREKFQAAKLDLIHLDEEPTKEIYNECLMRVMSTDEENTAIILLTMTPLMGLTDLVLSFQEEARKKTIINAYNETEEVTEQVAIPPGVIHGGKMYVEAGWNDNPYLLEEEKERMRKNLRKEELEAREKGIASIGSGLVYPIAEDCYLWKGEIEQHWSLVFGMDFGWNPSPTAVVFLAYDRDNDIVYCYDEYSGFEMAPSQHSQHLIRRGCTDMPGAADPAGLGSNQKDGDKLIDLYRQCGLRNIQPADNSVWAGVEMVLTRFRQRKLFIHERCVGLRRELSKYSTDEKGDIKKGDDHFCDALRYAIVSGLSMARPPSRKPQYTASGWGF